MDAHVFGILQWSAEVEILEVSCNESGIGSRKDTVDHALDGCKVGCFGAGIKWVVDEVATNSPTDPVWIIFLRAICTYNAEVGGAFVARDGRLMDEADGFGKSEASNFLGIGITPQVAITALTEFWVFRKGTSVGVECVAMECQKWGNDV